MRRMGRRHFEIPLAFDARFSRQSHENGSFAAKTRIRAKIIPPATQSRLQRKTDPKALITSGRLVRQIEISAR